MERQAARVKVLEYPLFADENLPASVVRELRERSHDVETVFEARLTGRSDREILRHAYASGRVVVTQDSDFGTLARRDGKPFIGIVFLRPGDLRAHEAVECLDAIRARDVDVTPSFIAVAAHRRDHVRVRIVDGIA